MVKRTTGGSSTARRTTTANRPQSRKKTVTGHAAPTSLKKSEGWVGHYGKVQNWKGENAELYDGPEKWRHRSGKF